MKPLLVNPFFLLDLSVHVLSIEEKGFIHNTMKDAVDMGYVLLKVKRVHVLFLVVVAVLLCVAVYFVLNSQSGVDVVDRETLFQVASFKMFAQGEYDAIMSYAELAKHGDFGMGTLTGLDGEMVAVDGVFYHIATDGNPRQITPSEETPFATVTFFEADQTFHVADAMNYSELTAYIDQNISPDVAMYAIRVHGEYDYVQTRSVPKQVPPYPTLAEVVKNQTVFTLSNFTGTIAGFRLPSYMIEVNVAGYHLHFISDDKLFGGHLLDCVVRNATIDIDYTYNYELFLQENP
jgi:acetolactate decarboxylase